MILEPAQRAGSMSVRRRRVLFPFLLTLLLSASLPMSAYSVLTHEQLIDLAWNESIRPLLLSRYPNATPSELEMAHAYAYGGSAIQDMGYYPFGKAFFSDLTHYVRSGDFVLGLFRNSRNVYELAFAVGALSHYLGDDIGHRECVNRATAVEFPRLAKKYGDSVTYDESPHSHVRTEFAFDIDQLSQHRLAPSAYLEHVGLKVPRRLLERAFYETYGLYLHQVLGPEVPSVRSYRSSVRSFIPRFAHAELVLHGSGFPSDVDDEVFRRYEHEVEKADYQKHWAGARHHPGFRTHALAVLIFLLPRVGPLSDLAIRGPTQQTEDWYVDSVVHTMAQLNATLATLRSRGELAVSLPNRDLDTGEILSAGAYRLTDRTYAELLKRITADPRRRVPPGLRRDILAFYEDPGKTTTVRNNDRALRQIESELRLIRRMPLREAEETQQSTALQ